MVRFFSIFIIISAASSFLLQLIMNSKLGAVFPYIFMIIGFLLVKRSKYSDLPGEKATLAVGVIFLYAWLIIIKIVINYYHIGSLHTSAADVFNYLLPIMVYFYYLRISRWDNETSLLIGLVISGIYASIFFVYDSLYRILNNEVPEFARMAFQYSMDMMGRAADEMNPVRIAPTARAMGIMTSHSMSATWISFGAFAAFTLLKGKYFNTIFLVTASLLLIGLNYTGIVAFLAVTFLCYSENTFGRIHNKIHLRKSVFKRKLYLMAFIVAALLLVSLRFKTVSDRIFTSVTTQTKFILDEGPQVEHSYLDLIGKNIILFIKIRSTEIAQFAIGNIPSANSNWLVGGDIGFLDSISLLGFPFWFLLISIFAWVFIKWYLNKGDLLSSINNTDSIDRKRFLISVILFLLIMDLHYSVWMNKSIQIVLFASLGFGLAKWDRGSQHAL